jgi:hypothetical protein
MNSHYFTVALVLGSIAAGPLLAQETAPQDPTKMPQAELAKVQQALKQRGYDPGKVDGTWGSESTQALAAFQASRAIATTHGLIDSSTLHALHVAAPQPAPPKGEPVTDKPTESSVAPGGGTTGGTVNTQATAPGPPWAWPAASERRPHKRPQSRALVAPHATTSSADENASADQYLRDAQTALRGRRIREAQKALEGAETRALNSAPGTNASQNSTINAIERAREALGHVRYLRPDLARGGQMIDQAMSETASKSKSTGSLSSGPSGSTNGTNGSVDPHR